MRKELPVFEKDLAHRDILEKIKNHEDIDKSSHVMVYISMPGEVETREIVEYLLEGGKKVYVPVIENEMIKVSRINSIEDLVPGKFGIPEPLPGERKYMGPEILDIVIVPGVCFTEKGLRLGRGGGYYDRFLKKIEKKTRIIGICYKNQIAKKIPSCEHDHQVDEVIFG
jgi:5-formyltetrahydrofolate cyclo-ligase